jgi:proliferating cell nuclear antigen PCNA
MGHILEIKTMQSGPFRILIEALHSLLADVNFIFTPEKVEDEPKDNNKENSSESEDSDMSDDSDDSEDVKKSEEEPPVPVNKVGGLKIHAINKSKTKFIHVKLNADKFDYYYCRDSRLILGINLINLCKYIKSMSNFDTITLAVEEDNRDELKIILENSMKCQKITYRLHLVELDKMECEIKPIKFPYCIHMPSQDFHMYCKNMASFADNMQIICTSKKIEFRVDGEQGPIHVELGQTVNGLTIDSTNNCNKIVQGTYELKTLVLFTKCTGLCNNVSIYIENDCAIIVKYDVAALGNIKLCLSQKKRES